MNPSDLTHLLKSTSQEAKVFRALYRAPGEVSLPVLSRRSRSLNISKRVSVLRQRFGLAITNRVETIKGSTLKKSFYRLAI